MARKMTGFHEGAELAEEIDRFIRPHAMKRSTALRILLKTALDLNKRAPIKQLVDPLRHEDAAA